MRLVLVLPIVLCLSACSGSSSPACPENKDWTKQEQIEIAKEHNALPANSILRGVLADYERVRRGNPD